MRSPAAVALLILTATGVAMAQPGAPVPAPVPPRAPPQTDGERSESAALWLSLGGTAASWGLLVLSPRMGSSGEEVALLGGLGTILGPSLGHIYAGRFGTPGLGLRTAGLGAASLGTM